MEKKKLKLSISGSSKKTFKSIEQATTQSKNTVVIEKKSTKFPGKSQFKSQNNRNEAFKGNSVFPSKKNNFSKTSPSITSDFEKRKLAEQRATRRLKGELTNKDTKANKFGGKRRELKLTITRALSEDDVEIKARSLASLKIAKQKENRNLNQDNFKESLKPIIGSFSMNTIVD